MRAPKANFGLAATIDSDRLWQRLQEFVGVRHHEASPARLEETADRLMALFRLSGWRVEEESFDAVGRSNRNILARRDDAHGAPILIAAHYDTVRFSPGADDNASGLAVLAELAAVLGPRRLPRPVSLAAFALEEEGLLGSRYHLKRLEAERNLPLGMIALECVAYAVEGPGTQRTPTGLPIRLPDAGNFIGAVSNQAGTAMLEGFKTSAERVGLPVVALVVPGDGAALPDTRRSDHAPFWDRGLPAMMLTDTAEFRNPHYHRVTDRPDHLNRDFLLGVCRALVEFVTSDSTS